MKVFMETIPHDQHRYETVGDYFYVEDISEYVGSTLGLIIQVSNMVNADHEFLVALHEFIESYLVQKARISHADIDAFDKQFERDREQGLLPQDMEPGDDSRAPYRRQHRFANFIEHLVAAELGVDWIEYDKAVQAL